MPVSATPNYLGNDFSSASPGLRFGYYLKAWSPRDWSRPTSAATTALRDACQLTDFDKKTLRALTDRQERLFLDIASESGLALPAVSTAPFTTGLGNEHPLENGFAFLWPYGLPYLPGSGVKGVLRQAARELAMGLWGDSRDWTDDATTALFGAEDSDKAQRGALTFWDVIPQLHGNTLQVEVMTPHQSKYYQGKESPHDSGQPVPIYFLTVPPGSEFTFHCVCDRQLLRHTAPDLAKDDRWKPLLEAAFQHAFEWLGFGAKTAVGYGAMQIDLAAQEAARNAQAEARQAAERQQAIEQATAGLPADAAQIERWRRENTWPDNNRFLESIEALLGEYETLTPAACQRLREEMDARWKGILQNPEATQGKKKKARYKPRPKALALRILAQCSDTRDTP